MSVDVSFSEEDGDRTNKGEGEGGCFKFQAWKVREGLTVRLGAVLMSYKKDQADGVKYVKTNSPGVVQSMAKLKTGQEITNGQFLLRLQPCEHPVVMKDLCADCGEDLRKKEGFPGERVVQTQARVAMIHHIPELQITPEEAKSYGTADEQNLLNQRRLVLLVDLDQTLIHTTNEDVGTNLKDVFHFQLYGSTSPWYHTRLRPHTRHFLDAVSKLFELHICTFGARLYAHTVAKILDPEGTLFGHRILSREECFDANLKIANLKALFPCGDRLVCIIDDREDVWNYASNVVHVKPYRFFKHTGDINAPPGFSKNGQKSAATTASGGTPADDKDSASPEDSAAAVSLPEESNSSASASAITTTPDEEKSEIVSADCAIAREEGQNLGDGAPQYRSQNQDQNQNLDLDQQDDDDYLYHLEDILARVHTAFYQMYDQQKQQGSSSSSPSSSSASALASGSGGVGSGSGFGIRIGARKAIPDLKSVVPYVKNKVLKNCNVVFSGVVPTNVPLETSAIFKTAVAFGANVHKEIVIDRISGDHHQNRSHHHHHHNRKSSAAASSPSSSISTATTTTHLIAAKWGTAKVYQARKVGNNVIKIVTPQWLWCCAERWEREDERLFLFTKEDANSTMIHNKDEGKKRQHHYIERRRQKCEYAPSSSITTSSSADAMMREEKSSDPKEEEEEEEVQELETTIHLENESDSENDGDEEEEDLPNRKKRKKKQQQQQQQEMENEKEAEEEDVILLSSGGSSSSSIRSISASEAEKEGGDSSPSSEASADEEMAEALERVIE